jgi:predicted ribosome quality control (RQC) complex YloA/Tae2 family protein
MFFENKKTGVCEMDWKIVEQISEELNRSKFYIIRINDRLHLSLIPIGDIVKSFEDPIAANNFFFIENLKTAQLSSEQNRAVKQLQKRIEQTESYLVETEKSLAKLKNGISNQQIGHILMANLYRIPTNAEYVELNDFETGELISIKLKKTLSAQKNAEIFYRKSKNEKLEIEFLEKNITVKQSLLNELRQKLEETEKVESLRDFRAFIKTELPKESKKRPPKPEELFKCFEKNGFRIWVGRNAKNNDVLTLKYADKNDTWLHAKDVSGSHVVIKQIPGSKIPKDVLEYAAELAAYYSKRRTDSLVPVAYTLKKNVRKIKGSPDGQVFVEKENSILVKPLADPA